MDGVDASRGEGEKNDRNNLPYTRARAAASARGEEIFEIPACTRVRYPLHRGSRIHTNIYMCIIYARI